MGDTPPLPVPFASVNLLQTGKLQNLGGRHCYGAEPPLG